MPIHILTKNETREIEKELNKKFGISEIPGVILRSGKERLFLFSGSLNAFQIKELEKIIPIERIGVYFAKLQENEIRLTIEGTHIFKNQLNKNIFELENYKDVEKWMHGNEILIGDLRPDNKTISKDYNINNKPISEQSEPNKVGEGSWGVEEKKYEKENPRGFVIIKYKNDFLGTGKASQSKITNFIPKARRLKN